MLFRSDAPPRLDSLTSRATQWRAPASLRKVCVAAQLTRAEQHLHLLSTEVIDAAVGLAACAVHKQRYVHERLNGKYKIGIMKTIFLIRIFLTS